MPDVHFSWNMPLHITCQDEGQSPPKTAFRVNLNPEPSVKLLIFIIPRRSLAAPDSGATSGSMSLQGFHTDCYRDPLPRSLQSTSKTREISHLWVSQKGKPQIPKKCMRERNKIERVLSDCCAKRLYFTGLSVMGLNFRGFFVHGFRRLGLLWETFGQGVS